MALPSTTWNEETLPRASKLYLKASDGKYVRTSDGTLYRLTFSDGDLWTEESLPSTTWTEA